MVIPEEQTRRLRTLLPLPQAFALLLSHPLSPSHLPLSIFLSFGCSKTPPEGRQLYPLSIALSPDVNTKADPELEGKKSRENFYLPSCNPLDYIVCAVRA